MIKTAEAVTPKHPDKICDQIADAILDACLEQDPDSRVAIEVMGGHGIITITGELTTKAYVNMREIAQRVAGNQYGVQVNVVKQSEYIAQGVDTGGAGDQGIMVGYACDENEAMIPHELYLARSLCKFIYDKYPYDGKTQVTIDENKCITDIVASFQNTTNKELFEIVTDWLDINGIEPKDAPTLFLNPAGDWTQGGFEADTGVTGRKLAVDNYGPQIPIGGGAFSGKDPSKVDRSGAYMARFVAVQTLKKNKIKGACEVFVKIAYAIGVDEPVMITIEIRYKDGEITNVSFDDAKELSLYDLTPKGIIKTLKLKRPQYEKTARFGHFGEGFEWDK